MHHGLWDYDNPTAPNLLDITVRGKKVKALAQISKQGFVYALDRVTGKPIWPIVERRVPASDVPGEVVASFSLGVEADRIAGELAEQLSAGPLVPSDEADDLIAPYEGAARDLVDLSLAQLATDPDAAVRSALTVDLLRDGYLASPEVDEDLLDAMHHEIVRGVEVWGDDRFVVVVELLP